MEGCGVPTWSPVQPAEVEVSHGVGVAEEMRPCAEDPGHGGGARKARSFCPPARALPLCPAGSAALAGVPTASFSPSSCPGSVACRPAASLPSPTPASGRGPQRPLPTTTSGRGPDGGRTLEHPSGLKELPLALPVRSAVWTLTCHSPRAQAAAPSLWGCSPIVAPPGIPPPCLPSATHPSRPSVSPPSSLRGSSLPTATVHSTQGTEIHSLRNTAANSHCAQLGAGVGHTWDRWREC